MRAFPERIARVRDETLSQVLRRALRTYVREHAQMELPKPSRTGNPRNGKNGEGNRKLREK